MCHKNACNTFNLLPDSIRLSEDLLVHVDLTMADFPAPYKTPLSLCDVADLLFVIFPRTTSAHERVSLLVMAVLSGTALSTSLSKLTRSCQSDMRFPSLNSMYESIGLQA